ncbi:MAG: hypothetical protein J7L82_03505 [Staphylothermus sp.]|nr:hypothetical protein [Staphylothermus sp.]
MDTTIISEARNVVKSSMQRIDRRILSRSTELKANIVSIASRMYDLLNYLDLILGGVEDRITKEEKESNTYAFGPYFYIAMYGDSFTLVRSKPYTITVSYKQGEGKIYIRTRNFRAVISPTILELTKYNMNINVDVGSIEDITSKFPELKYLLKTFGRIIEFKLLPLAEKRLGITV